MDEEHVSLYLCTEEVFPVIFRRIRRKKRRWSWAATNHCQGLRTLDLIWCSNQAIYTITLADTSLILFCSTFSVSASQPRGENRLICARWLSYWYCSQSYLLAVTRSTRPPYVIYFISFLPYLICRNRVAYCRRKGVSHNIAWLD